MTVAVSSIEGVAAALVTANINTDVIVRIERLAEHGRGELAPFAFEAWRFDEAGKPKADFVLNRPPFDAARILIAGRNFGCGSSREGAVWALQDFGIGCIIAPSFGDIFHNNCFQNGLLPVVLPPHAVESLAEEAQAGGTFRVDLRTQSLRSPAGRVLAFNVDPVKRLALLEGRDEISLTLSRTAEIDRFQQHDRLARPWIYEIPST